MNIEEERARFEEWAREAHPGLAFNYDALTGSYVTFYQQARWEAWQASSAIDRTTPNEQTMFIDQLTREETAVSLMQGMLANPTLVNASRAELVKTAIETADLLLAELRKESL